MGRLSSAGATSYDPLSHVLSSDPERFLHVGLSALNTISEEGLCESHGNDKETGDGTQNTVRTRDSDGSRRENVTTYHG
jgi:hypothetical protein